VPATAPAKAAEEPAAHLTVKNIITRGGGIMYALVALSVLTVMLVLFCILTLRTGIICPVAFLRQAQDAAEAGDFETLADLSHADASPVAKVLSAACEQHLPGRPLDPPALRQSMEEEGARQVSRLWGRAQYLMDVGTIAPMVGLLGTVWGMMVSFTGLESGIAIVNKADRLANGVSQAMFTTFGGLIIGIVAFTAYALFRSRINRLTAELETACAAILRRLAASGSVPKQETASAPAPQAPAPAAPATPLEPAPKPGNKPASKNAKPPKR
jgi:biopolymer transport protein ExbB